MTRNIKFTSPDTSIQETAKIMYENHLPSLLIEENGDTIGIVTYDDIALALTIYDQKITSPIKEIMSSPVVSVPSGTSILKAVELMLDKKIHKITIIDNGKSQGIISSSDLMVLFSMLSEEQLYGIFKSQISN